MKDITEFNLSKEDKYIMYLLKIVILLVTILGVVNLSAQIYEQQKEQLLQADQTKLTKRAEARLKCDSLETLINTYTQGVIAEAEKVGAVDYLSGIASTKGKKLDSLVRDLYRQKRELIQRE